MNRNHFAPFLLPTIVLLSTSGCTTERQVFSDGKIVEWHRKLSTGFDESPAGMPHGSTTLLAQPNDGDLSAAAPSSPISIEPNQSIAAFVDDETTGDVLVSRHVGGGMRYGSAQTILPSAREANGLLTTSTLNNDAGEERDGNKGLVAGGWVVTVVGLLLLLFISILLGLILMLGGIAMVVAGSPKKSSGSKAKVEKEKAGEWQDVVYLQNGSIIRGMVIEQVPNVSIKIQTSDGSIFVYEMKDVAKIAKEQKK